MFKKTSPYSWIASYITNTANKFAIFNLQCGNRNHHSSHTADEILAMIVLVHVHACLVNKFVIITPQLNHAKSKMNLALHSVNLTFHSTCLRWKVEAMNHKWNFNMSMHPVYIGIHTTRWRRWIVHKTIVHWTWNWSSATIWKVELHKPTQPHAMPMFNSAINVHRFW